MRMPTSQQQEAQQQLQQRLDEEPHTQRVGSVCRQAGSRCAIGGKGPQHANPASKKASFSFTQVLGWQEWAGEASSILLFDYWGPGF